MITHRLNSKNNPAEIFAPQLMEVLEQSDGTTIAITEEDIVARLKEIAKVEGNILSPDGAVTWMALAHLEKNRIISKEYNILLLNTGSRYKYLDNIWGHL